jgi:hypothetical protein
VVDGAQQRGLPGAGRAEDHGDLAGPHLQVDAAQHLERTEALVDAETSTMTALMRSPS